MTHFQDCVFRVIRNDQTGCRAHQASCTLDTCSVFQGLKAAWALSWSIFTTWCQGYPWLELNWPPPLPPRCLYIVHNDSCVVCILSFGPFPGVWILYADVSEHSVCSIFIGGVRRKNNRVEMPLTSRMKMEQTGCSETSAYKIQTPGNDPRERIRHSEHGESLKSRTMSFFAFTSMYTIRLQILKPLLLAAKKKGARDLRTTSLPMSSFMSVRMRFVNCCVL